MSAVFPIIIAAAIGEGWTLALLAAGIILLVEIMVGQVLEPLFFGRMTGLSTFAIVASAAFWATLGPNRADPCNAFDSWLAGDRAQHRVPEIL